MLPLYLDVETARRELAARRPTVSLERPDDVRARDLAVFGEELTTVQVVDRIVADVRENGDPAIRKYIKGFEGVELGPLEVDPGELEAAYQAIPEDLRAALEVAAQRVRAFHERSRRESWFDFKNGSAMGQLIVPIARVGIYAPGGRAAYPSTVLMAAVPARVAGVNEVILVTPVGRDGQMNQSVLAAARIAGVDRVFRIGGAQAIAALAYGTESVPKVDKIVGPGSIFVVLAKQAVSGVVGIDMIPGPTETLVVADATADPRWIAADMIAQAEHDPMAQSVLVCTERSVAEAVLGELEGQLEKTPRRDLVEGAFGRRGAVVVVDSIDSAIDLANEHAPEHLCLSVADPWSYLSKVRAAGGVFIGEESVEALGDYTAGPSHIMPTGGTARYASAVSLDDFQRVVPVFSYDANQLRPEAEAAMAIAHAEGLVAHADAIAARLEVTEKAPPTVQVVIQNVWSEEEKTDIIERLHKEKGLNAASIVLWMNSSPDYPPVSGDMPRQVIKALKLRQDANLPDADRGVARAIATGGHTAEHAKTLLKLAWMRSWSVGTAREVSKLRKNHPATYDALLAGQFPDGL